MQRIASVALASSVLLTAAQGAKDDSYYKPGSGNPNVYQKMYWKDADNVLEDLSQFQTLYVEFQHCAWTWMNYGDEEEEGSVDENDYWYMGKVPPFGANVAYSLYGSLKGESFSGCNANTFINSFYTRTGFSEFVYAMAYAGVSAFNQYDFSGYSSECQGYYGVGCDYSNGFAVHQYSTQECNPKYVTGVSDNMQYLNQALQSAQCVKIFDASSKSNWNGYNYTVSGTPLELLAYSQACFYQNYWSPDGECPDPYSKLQFYQENFNRGVTKSKRSDPFEQYTLQVAESKRLAAWGTIMLVAAAVILAAGFLFPTIKKKLPKLSHLRLRRLKRATPEIGLSTDDVKPSISVADNNDQRVMADTEILRDPSYEETPPAPPTHKKMIMQAMFGKK